MRSSTLLALAASLASTTAVFQGFNYGAKKSDYSAMKKQDFEDKFNLAKSITPNGAFTSARLYDMVQAYTTDTYTEAIPAAMNTKTSLLLTLWSSAGDAAFANQVTALKSAIADYGNDLKKQVVGISVGSEDLYRNSTTGIAAKAGPGANATVIAKYIGWTKGNLTEAGWGDMISKVGHVDTWTAWADGANAQVWGNCSWIGQDAYPYWQAADSNSIDNAKSLWQQALDATHASTGKAYSDIWVTETGWAVSGPNQNLAVASKENAQRYWQEVGCPLLASDINTWWFTLQSADTEATIPSPDFSIVGPGSSTPLYNLTCGAVASSSNGVSSTATSSSVSKSSATGVVGGSDSKSGSSSIVDDSSSSASSTKSSSGSSASAVKGSGGSSVWSPYSSATGIVATASGSATIVHPGANTTVVSATLSTAQATTPLSTPTSASASSSPSSTGVSTSGANGLSGSFLGAIGAIVAALVIL